MNTWTRWRAAADEVQLWKVARKLVSGGQFDWSQVQEEEGFSQAAECWQSSSTSREEGKEDSWHACTIKETRDQTVLLVRKCSQEGVSYDIVRWIGCLQGMRHPCIAALQMVYTSHVQEKDLWSARVYAGFERTDDERFTLIIQLNGGQKRRIPVGSVVMVGAVIRLAVPACSWED